ncbi:MAG: S8/S53 family peptidase [Granulosicoccus sp.]
MQKARAIFQLGLVLSVFFLSSLNAQSLLVDVADNPPVPEQLESAQRSSSQSIHVALVDSGVNYLLPEINEYLARDQDGKLLGYDFWDLDERPFDAHPNGRGQIQRHGTRTASLLLREAPFVKLVPYRYPRPDMSRMQDLLAHAAANDVRVIGLPLGGNRIEDWQVFNKFAQKHPDILFVSSAGNNGRDIDQRPVYPASLPLDNMLVVTSADDFVLPAEGVNWGRSSVDYMVPAEQQRVLRFDGSSALASGSSYAVPRVVALAARLIRDNREWQAADLIAELRRRFANGSSPAKIAQGYLHDPQVDARHSINTISTVDWSSDAGSNADSSKSASNELNLPLDVLVLDEGWSIDDVSAVLDEAAEILSVCNVHFSDVKIRLIDAPEYLRDLESGSAKTLMDAVRLSGPQRRTTAVFANDTRMSRPFDAEAFGRGNTRTRPWLTDSVWLTLALKDRGIALAHELFHVLSNSGQHSDATGNLMLARTTGNNRALSQDQCHSARNRAIDMGLLENEG